MKINKIQFFFKKWKKDSTGISGLKKKRLIEDVICNLQEHKDNLDCDEINLISPKIKNLKLTIEYDNPQQRIETLVTINLQKNPLNAFERLSQGAQRDADIAKAKKEKALETLSHKKNQAKENENKQNKDQEETKEQKEEDLNVQVDYSIKKTRRKFSVEEKEAIIETYLVYGHTFTLCKYGLSEGTLNTMITNYNKRGTEAFTDKRKYNKGQSITEMDSELVKFIEEKRELFLPVTLKMVQIKALSLSTDKEFCA